MNQHNPFRNPHLWSNEDLRVLIGIFRSEFTEFCEFARPASANRRSILSHESRVFLFLFRYVHGISTELLGTMFKISADTAMKVYDAVLFFLLMHDENIPRIWNDRSATEQDIEDLLRNIIDQQSEGIR